MNGLLAAFGLILVGSVAAILSPLAVRWRGKPGADGLLTREEHHRKKRIGLEIGIPTRAWLDFECRVETKMDRFFKHLGWTREIQVGRNPFDKTVYLTADDPRIEALMRENEEACALLQRLVASLPPEGAGLRQIVCRDGVLRISLTTPDAADGEEIRQWALPRLRALQAALPPPGGLSVARRDRAMVHAALVGGLCGGLALNGLVQLVRLWFVTGVPVVDGAALLQAAAWTTAAVVAVLLALAFWLVGRSSRFHHVLLKVLLLGSLGTFSSAYMGLSDLNRATDSSPVERRHAVLLPGESLRLSRRSKVPRAEVYSAGLPAGLLVRMPRGYASQPGMPMVAMVLVRRGGLGLTWLEGVDTLTEEEWQYWQELLDQRTAR